MIKEMIQMKGFLNKSVAAAVLSVGMVAGAQAIPVTINMTGDNLVASGGLCFTSACTGGVGWSAYGSTANLGDWTVSTSMALDLAVGTHSFAWNIQNYGGSSSGNPAALLAEILWDGGANYSSSAWEVYSINTGALIENATEYGANGGANIWSSVLGGAVSGISTDANWIYGSANYQNAPSSLWLRTSITIAEVSEPATLALFGLGLLGLGMVRRKNNNA